MAVRAKFTVQSIERRVYGGGEEANTITLSPVVANSEENKGFFRRTPSGEIKLLCLNPAASAEFELGKEYYIDFIKAE